MKKQPFEYHLGMDKIHLYPNIPLGRIPNTFNLTFLDLFDLREIQKIQDAFAKATGVASLITTPDGRPITNPSNFCRLCRSIIRRTKKGLANCRTSAISLGRYNPDGPNIEPCKCNGLIDGGACINVGDRHIANWIIGQVRDGSTDMEEMIAYARDIGADEKGFLEALNEVVTMPAERFQEIANALFIFANVLSKMAFQNVGQARLIQERNIAIRELIEHRDLLEESVFERTADLAQTNKNLKIEIGERMKADQGFEASKEKLDSIIRTIPDIVYRLDGEGAITFISNSIKEYGYTPEELIGMYLMDLVHPEDRDKAVYHVNERRTGRRRTEQFEVRLLIKHDKETPFELFSISAEGLYSSKNPNASTLIGTQGIARDITYKREAQKERLYREKLQGVLEMAGAVCHELTQPMQSISGYSELLLMELSEDNPLYKKVDKIQSQIFKMGEITKKITSITKYETKEYINGQKIIDIEKSATAIY